MALTNRDAQVVLGMIARGDNKHDIAAWFGENQARIAEVEQGSHGHPPAAAAEDLFPKGSPGPKGRKLRGAVKNALLAIEKGDIDGAERALKNGLENFNRNEA
ncbi:hypothetical protein [uncultured Ruegeria sp.]|uniref:hypothetical protein n=1 Tax=uncultured Ruegeria sp. TaxID=259304 RepID=UPI00260FE018|nr:hypothetical protein [uncultured Ruegeria sp.]